MGRKRTEVELKSIPELQKQIDKFGMVIGAYDINATVKEATAEINKLQEIINNYEQAHEDDQVLIRTMDGMLSKKDSLSESIVGLGLKYQAEVDAKREVK